ncbi:uncharacterized protein LOC120686322 isoform X2 [Panicum virgatum]|uniref:Uncharacterized protein n=1 Tax=Panicum virgatum TaxID=38727 RepID=A0A8T0P5E6_PANVG|nr:uncharacterized protein LOC120686322 isoform X2 [Panicum virgatum]KAG2556856.1 hypothetical protein PVAP13_8NG156100 [Panicum virgatum]KAG2556859.1 hypothetical protein PVAP13_8NG156100 [Panicum virgatum]KAG2556860.1 hypothetical protein PVAP13_8NG156100 [Panicum virgatum]
MWTIRIIVPPARLVRHLPNSSPLAAPPKSGQPPGGRLPRLVAVGNSGGTCLVARTCAMSNDATFYSGPPATTPGATQQPQVTGGVQNPVASSQTAGPNKRLLRRSPDRGEAAAAAGAGAAAA